MAGKTTPWQNPSTTLQAIRHHRPWEAAKGVSRVRAEANAIERPNTRLKPKRFVSQPPGISEKKPFFVAYFLREN